MLVQKLKRPHSVDRVRAGEPFDLAAVTDPELRLIQEPDLGELAADRVVGTDAVKVPALDHERPGGDQRGHLGVVEGTAQVPLENLVLIGPYITVRRARRGVLADPLVEVARAD